MVLFPPRTYLVPYQNFKDFIEIREQGNASEVVNVHTTEVFPLEKRNLHASSKISGNIFSFHNTVLQESQDRYKSFSCIDNVLSGSTVNSRGLLLMTLQ